MSCTAPTGFVRNAWRPILTNITVPDMKNKKSKYELVKVDGRWRAHIEFYTKDLYVAHSWDVNFDESKPHDVCVLPLKKGKIQWSKGA